LIISGEIKLRSKLACRFIRKNGTKLATLNLIISFIGTLSGFEIFFLNAIFTTSIIILISGNVNSKKITTSSARQPKSIRYTVTCNDHIYNPAYSFLACNIHHRNDV